MCKCEERDKGDGKVFLILGKRKLIKSHCSLDSICFAPLYLNSTSCAITAFDY